jgi:hypothetical protein
MYCKKDSAQGMYRNNAHLIVTIRRNRQRKIKQTIGRTRQREEGQITRMKTNEGIRSKKR